MGDTDAPLVADAVGADDALALSVGGGSGGGAVGCDVADGKSVLQATSTGINSAINIGGRALAMRFRDSPRPERVVLNVAPSEESISTLLGK